MDSAWGATTRHDSEKGNPLDDGASLKKKPGPVVCLERLRLAEAFLDATREVIALQDRQMQALNRGDGGFTRFDRLLHEAQGRKEAAKYAWLNHVETHNCEKD